ncbi:DUF1573 domain-containing protein [Agriterribacter sp.]|uniref:DUF1573 domain-containing protein n=1 Tax=Agriterribacter sp. TaxID=2821509 RepID=UPI002C7B254C|nr:DUF1573 domain-containing protein [Agriterribacter sp.]HRO45041.1 DUF1573 domain-containing protein [Agriterribacter sp.]HRQ15518.1 DUF1573 domain-containing protein [Agriterribacter sp.]
MKKLLFTMAAFAITSWAVAQKTEGKQKAEDLISFKEKKHDFGKIKQGSPVTYDFAFQNTSDKPVVIENAWASCGCTTPTKPEQPVAKGKSNVIKAGFNAAAAGPFDKTVYVKVQGIDIPLELRITGNVLNAEAYAKYESENKKNKGGK